MSQPWEERRAGAGGGSVREARQRAEAGIPLKLASPPKQRQFDQYRPNQAGPRSRPQGPAGYTGVRDAQGQIGVAISRPTQVPQWPLAGALDNTQYQPPVNRGPAPQRPPRPSVVPSILDSSRLQDPSPTFQYNSAQNSQQRKAGTYYEDNENVSPTTPDFLSPNQLSSRPSTISSVGSIPEFPIPIPAIPQSYPVQGPRRSGNLGPPPLSRRGVSSYYSQATFVSPIPEESPRTTLAPSHQSYASSAAIPSGWSGNPDSPLSPGFINDDYYASNGQEDGRVSRGSTQDDSDDRGLIRSASIGKRAKPSMITTKSSERLDSERPITQMPRPLQTQRSRAEEDQRQQQQFPADLMPPSAIGNTQRSTLWPTIGNADSPLASGTGLMDPTPSTSAESVPTIKFPGGGARGHTPSNSDGKANAILGSPVATQPSGLGPIAVPLQSRTPSPGGNRMSAVRRPPRLNIDAVREAEARGSLTSLPDLILRATRLASMMDRGKRPGSRLNNLDDFPMDIDLSSRDKETNPGNGRMSGLSGMLASFPPPGNETPRDSTFRPQSSWPSGYGQNGEKDGKDQKRPRREGRRCCGMPCWLALLLNFILLLVIAAAVVVPVYFLVIKKDNSTPALTAVQKCQKDTATSCQNGGMASTSTGSCSCICINGFTGPTCTTFDGACASTSFSINEGSNGSTQVANATLGDAITRLIDSAQANFSIPLTQSVLLSRFNNGGVSCVSQNALVTFDGQSRRIAAANAVVLGNDARVSLTRTRNLRRQGSPTSSASSTVGTAASGIIFDTGSPSPPSSTSASTTSNTGSSTSPSSDFDTSKFPVGALFNITQEVLDFSRVAVLYVLQERDLDAATVAQSNLQKFIGIQAFTNGAARNVSIGAGSSVDLLAWRVDIGKGLVGGRRN